MPRAYADVNRHVAEVQRRARAGKTFPDWLVRRYFQRALERGVNLAVEVEYEPHQGVTERDARSAVHSVIGGVPFEKAERARFVLPSDAGFPKAISLNQLCQASRTDRPHRLLPGTLADHHWPGARGRDPYGARVNVDLLVRSVVAQTPEFRFAEEKPAIAETPLGEVYWVEEETPLQEFATGRWPFVQIGHAKQIVHHVPTFGKGVEAGVAAGIHVNGDAKGLTATGLSRMLRSYARYRGDFDALFQTHPNRVEEAGGAYSEALLQRLAANDPKSPAELIQAVQENDGIHSIRQTPLNVLGAAHHLYNRTGRPRIELRAPNADYGDGPNNSARQLPYHGAVLMSLIQYTYENQQ